MDKIMHNRLARIEGQIRGIEGMIEEDRSCKEVLSQLLAVRSAVDSLIVLMLRDRLEKCRAEEFDLEDIDEILDLLVRYLPEVKE